ncbi:haloacid dehalogenase type II [Paraburkholderia phymatum]|uniref:Haloacid dehalogenase, type II n=1 Tax=Paraburkholderia phymatum (strain DSM 17167 / CIP 108236 / LMG 21445 / STM815) TaxID=391038 RepID=B2JUF3_PARP8|nr:haloacid dehalogenase type II [Paraburkholderia phymatum]ACC74675.1 haloacid dehalogenase, type II [Paraburkholderia phymatum STM815]
MNTSDVKALVFDVFGTLVDWRSGVAREAAAFLQRHGRTAQEADVFADAWRARYQPAMEKVRSGERPFMKLDVLHRENLDQIASEWGLDHTKVPAAELDALNQAWHRLDPWPDTVEGLTRLKSRYIIAPLSNGNVRLMIDMAKHGGLPWDAILGAEVAQAYKPAHEAYLRTVDVLMLLPGQVCMVAAHNSDLAAAQKCGLRTAFIPRPHEHGAMQATDLKPEGNWDWVAQDLIDLAKQLGV